MKIGFVMMIVIMAVVVFFVHFTYGTCKTIVMMAEIQHMYSVGSTSLGIIGTSNSEKACDLIRDVYSSLSEEERNNPDDPDYLALFPDLDEYDEIDQGLIDFVSGEIEEKNYGIIDVGLCLHDSVNDRLIYVRDVDDQNCGYWDDFVAAQMSTVYGNNALYQRIELDRNESMTRPYYVRVLIPIDEYDKTDNLKGYMFIDEYDDLLNIWMATIMTIMVICLIFDLFIARLVGSITMKKLVIAPITKLAKAADEWANSPDMMADKFYFQDLKSITNDEVGDLRDAMAGMEKEIHSYMLHIEEEAKEKQRVTTELEFAARLQASMLPEKLKIENREFNIESLMRPARTVGGDFYDFFMIGEDKLVMVIADVSDKGVPASLFMVVSKTLINNIIKNNPDDIAQAMAKANRQICENNSELMFVTVFACIYSFNDKTLHYVNAGHEDPIVYRKCENCYSYIIEEHDLFIGVDPDISFTERSIQMAPGDKVFLYTDGVTEAMNTKDELFGTRRLLEVLNNNTSAGGNEVIVSLWNEIEDFQKNKGLSDDVTMLLFEA